MTDPKQDIFGTGALLSEFGPPGFAVVETYPPDYNPHVAEEELKRLRAEVELLRLNRFIHGPEEWAALNADNEQLAASHRRLVEALLGLLTNIYARPDFQSLMGPREKAWYEEGRAALVQAKP